MTDLHYAESHALVVTVRLKGLPSYFFFVHEIAMSVTVWHQVAVSEGLHKHSTPK